MKQIYKNFLIIWGITTLCSGIPLGWFGLLFGLISQTLAAIVITIAFNKELS